MNLIDRYISKIGENLPGKNRADIEAEIRSTLQDMLDSRSEKENRPIDDEMVAAVLKEFGSPEKVAQSYQEPRYLIGPRMFPIFWVVLRIVFGVMGIVALVSLGVRLFQPGVEVSAMPDMIVKAIIEFGTSALAALGNLVFIFAVLDYFVKKTGETAKVWDPRSLEKEEEDEPVGRIGATVEIILNALLVLVLNFYPNLIAIYILQGGQWTSYPMLSEAFFRYVPFISIVLLFDIVRDILVLRNRVQPRTLLWMSAAHSVMNIILVGAILSGPAILNPQGILSFGIEQAERLAELAGAGIRVALVVVMVLEVVFLVKKVVRLFGKGVQPLTMAHL